MSSGRKAACCHQVPGLLFPLWCHRNGENHKYMIEFTEPENNARDISLQNTLIAGSGRYTHLLLMGLRRANVNLTLHSLDLCRVFIKKGFSDCISASGCRKEGVGRKSHLLWGKVVGGTWAVPCANLWLGKGEILVSQGLLIWTSSKRKLPKINPKCCCPWGTPALPLQQGPLSPEGYFYSTSWKHTLAIILRIHRLPVCWHISPAPTHCTVKSFWQGSHSTRTAQAEGRRASLQPKRQDNHQHRQYGCFPLPRGGTSINTWAGSAKNWRLPSCLHCLILWWEQDLRVSCCGTNGSITHRCWPYCVRESAGTVLCWKQIISSYNH